MAEETDNQVSANGDNAGMSANADTALPTTGAPAAPPLPPPAAPGGGQPPKQPVAAEQPEAPGSHFKNLSHALQGAILGALAGGKHLLGKLAGPSEVVEGYDVDATGKMTPKKRQLHTGDRLQLMAQAALEGLAAGSRVGPQKNRMAALAAGIGAGADAQKQQGQQQDLLKRQQAEEQFTLEQKALTDKAVRAMHNASTYRLWQQAMDESNDHDPERKKNMDVVNAAQDYIARNPASTMKVQVMSPEEAMAVREADNHSVGKHTFLPVGMTQAKDQNGKPLFEADGVTPKQSGQVAVISGEGNIPLPQSFVDDVKEYGKLAGISGADQLKAGVEMPLANYLTADKRMNDVKVKEADGWKNATDAVLPDGKTHVQVNSFTQKTRPYPKGMTPLSVKKEEAEIADKQADAYKKTQEGNKAKQEGTGELPKILAKDLYQGRLAPPDLAKRKPEFQAQVIKEADALAKADGKSGYDFATDSIHYGYAKDKGTQNTLKFLNSLTGADNKGGNLAALIQVSDKVRRTSFPALNDAAAWARLQTGDPQILQFRTTALEVADQVAKILQGGGTGNGTSDVKLKQAMEMFSTGFTKAGIRAVADALQPLLGNRKKEMIGNNRYLLKDYGPPTLKVQLNGVTGHIPREKEWQFKEANPGAAVSEE